MTGKEMRAARKLIGQHWELGRALGVGELARILGIQPQTVTKYEGGTSPIPGPVALCLHWMQQGQLPPGGRAARRPAKP